MYSGRSSCQARQIPLSEKYMNIHNITIIGANGTVGSQVAGLLAAFCNARVFLISRSMEKSVHAIEKAVRSVRADSIRSHLIPKTYDELGECIQSSDWIFESVAEDFFAKFSINQMIAKYRKPGTIVSTGTSGLSIGDLAEVFNEDGRSLYFGTHFFNPPYSLPLLELVTTRWNSYDVTNEFSRYLESVVLRKVVKVQDRAGFLGNRIGFLFMNEVAQSAEKYKDRGGIDYMDAILGCFTGRTMSPLATMDFVGLDIHKSIIDHLHDCEPDFFHSEQIIPQYLINLISSGMIGRKVGCGFYKDSTLPDGSKGRMVFDIATDSFRPVRQYSFGFANAMIDCIEEGRYRAAFIALFSDESDEAKICKYFLMKYVFLSIVSAYEVANGLSDADIAMSYGFNWASPSALINLFGRKQIEVILTESFGGLGYNSFLYKELEEMTNNDVSSSVDYRRFFKAAY